MSNAAAAIPQVLLYNVYETLVRVDDSGKLVGLLAKSWKLSDDGLRLTFRLDPNARFASGARVTSAAVKASLERMRGASASPVNQANLAAIKAIHTPDDSTVISICRTATTSYCLTWLARRELSSILRRRTWLPDLKGPGPMASLSSPPDTR